MAELTQKQIHDLNLMNRICQTVKLGNLLDSLVRELPKEKHFCNHCFTISEQTDIRGNCISCGAPFGIK
jgi:hypothetical protein